MENEFERNTNTPQQPSAPYDNQPTASNPYGNPQSGPFSSSASQQPTANPYNQPQNPYAQQSANNYGTPNQQPSAQQQSGSYYSPRSGSGFPTDNGNGGNGNVPPEMPNDNASPKKPHSHKGLKALGLFAGIAFLCYASIQCYQFASQNEALRNFFGRNNSVSDEENKEERSLESNESSEKENKQSVTHSNTAQDWVELAAREDAMRIPDIVDKVMPASVGVSSKFVCQRQTYSMFGFGQPQTYEQEMTGVGTGIIMVKDGHNYILTNAHVIYDSSSEYNCGEAKEIQVVLNEECYDGDTQFEATIVGYDVAEDLAVLEIETDQKLVGAEFGSSDDLRVGELVIAIGNPTGFDLFGSVTTGIVSALDRKVSINESTMRLIQTDTAINQGNSGGPLINSYGQVIGINSAKFSSSYYDEASIEGLCFAIPMSHAKFILDDLINYGYVRGKPTLGIQSIDINESISEMYGFPIGVLVRDVTAGGAADLAGIKKGDVIIAINDKQIESAADINAMKTEFKAGDTIKVTITRNDTDIDFDVVLQEVEPENTNEEPKQKKNNAQT